MILVTLIYPLFVYSFKGMVKIKILEEFFTEIKEKRKNYQSYFDKYGKLGLFIFVFIPFWMTGPIVGVIVITSYSIHYTKLYDHMMRSVFFYPNL